MTCFVEIEINPEKASEMLARNYGNNRKVRKVWVASLATMMKNGEFVSQNGETLIIDDYGTLYDGQHRLQAVIESGKTYVFDVAVISHEIAEAAFLTIDNGTRRLTADYLQCKNRKTVGALAKYAYCLKYGNTSVVTAYNGRLNAGTMESPSRQEVIAFANSDMDTFERLVSDAKRTRSAIGAGYETAYAYTYYVIEKYGDASMLREFIEELCSNVPDNKTVNVCRTMIAKAYLSNKKPTATWLIGTLLDAYDHFTKLDNSTALNKAAKKINAYTKIVNTARLGVSGDGAVS